MLTRTELNRAEQLLVRLREFVAPPMPEFARDGQELPGILHCARTTSWMITSGRISRRRRRRSAWGGG